MAPPERAGYEEMGDQPAEPSAEESPEDRRPSNPEPPDPSRIFDAFQEAREQAERAKARRDVENKNKGSFGVIGERSEERWVLESPDELFEKIIAFMTEHRKRLPQDRNTENARPTKRHGNFVL
jgi:hypothetical protein